MSEDPKKQRIEDVKKLINAFCERHLNEEFRGFAHTLCDRIGRKRTLSITRGRPEIWAAAIIYTIARVNFLFDKTQPHSLTPDTICDFFGTVKSTVGNKAGLIIDVCDIQIAEPGLCTRKIEDMLTFYETPEGLLISKSMLMEMEAADSFPIDPPEAPRAPATQAPPAKKEPKKPQKKTPPEDDRQMKLFEDF